MRFSKHFSWQPFKQNVRINVLFFLIFSLSPGRSETLWSATAGAESSDHVRVESEQATAAPGGGRRRSSTVQYFASSGSPVLICCY